MTFDVDISPRMNAENYVSKSGRKRGVEFKVLREPEPWTVYRMCIFGKKYARFYDLVLGRG